MTEQERTALLEKVQKLQKDIKSTEKSWIVSQDSFNYGFGMMAVCPDCHRTVFIIGDELDDVEEYNFCPICGRQRISDE